MLTGEYHFHCQFSTPAVLPEFKGSMLRGGFGHALKKVVCGLQRSHCSGCLLSPTCIYALLFENIRSNDDSVGKGRISAPPQPYVLQPPITAKRAFDKGDPFDFTLLLFGRANNYLPHIIYAFENLGENGLNRSSKNKSAQFSLQSIRSGDAQVYDGTRKTLTHDLQLTDLNPPDPPDQPVTDLTVKFITPLRLKQHNRFQDDLPFDLLIRAALRRISILENAHGRGEPNLDYSGLVRRAAEISSRHNTLQWQELTRYSNRQKTSMQLGGMLGEITYQGSLTEFLPLLQYCEKVHLGKQTSFGLGRMKLEMP